MMEGTLKKEAPAGSVIDEILETKGTEYNAQETIKKLKEERKKLKRQISTKENDVNNLRRLLEESENMKKLYFISLKEARKITYKALRKGSATQNLINIIENNSINYKLKKKAINQLMLNAFGVIHHTKKTAIPDIMKYTDSHLKLFRQEQLILLAENERLAQQMKELKQQIVDNKIDFLKKNEKTFVMSMRHTKDSDKVLACDEKQMDDSYVELDADIVESKLNVLIKNIKMVQFKLLCYAFRKLTNYICCKIDVDDINNKIHKIYLKNGIKILKCVIEYKIRETLKLAFYKLLHINRRFTNFTNKNVSYYEGESNLNIGLNRKSRFDGTYISNHAYANEKPNSNTLATHLLDTNASDMHDIGSRSIDARSKVLSYPSEFSNNKEFSKNSYQIHRYTKKSMPYFIHKPYYYDNLPSANVEPKKSSLAHVTKMPEYITDYISNNQRNHCKGVSPYEFSNTFENLKKDIHNNINSFNPPFYGDDCRGSPIRMNVNTYESLDKKSHNIHKKDKNSSNHKNHLVENQSYVGLDAFEVRNDFNSP